MRPRSCRSISTIVSSVFAVEDAVSPEASAAILSPFRISAMSTPSASAGGSMD